MTEVLGDGSEPDQVTVARSSEKVDAKPAQRNCEGTDIRIIASGVVKREFVPLDLPTRIPRKFVDKAVLSWSLVVC